MVKKVVVDTSVFIEEIRCGSLLLAKLAEFASQRKISLYVPTVVIMELWAGKSMNKLKIRKAIKQKILPFKRIDINEEIAQKAGKLIRKDLVKGIDAIIAGCCLVEKAQVATLNKKHFVDIPGLKIF